MGRGAGGIPRGRRGAVMEMSFAVPLLGAGGAGEQEADLIGEQRACLPLLPAERAAGKVESHYVVLLAFSEMGAAFLSDACAIKGKQLTATAACLACLVCGLAGSVQGRKCFGNSHSSPPLHPPSLPAPCQGRQDGSCCD